MLGSAKSKVGKASDSISRSEDRVGRRLRPNRVFYSENRRRCSAAVRSFGEFCRDEGPGGPGRLGCVISISCR